jgi:PD-(D/E)XK nuclease superfamily
MKFTTSLGMAFLNRCTAIACTSRSAVRVYVCTGGSDSRVFQRHRCGQFKADLIVDNRILVELKAVQNLDRSHEAQVMNYLGSTQLEVGLLLNFGAPRPQFRRFAFGNENKKIRVYPR